MPPLPSPIRLLVFAAALLLASCSPDPCGECGPGFHCDEDLAACVRDRPKDCASNDDCPTAGRPVCDLDFGVCVECAQSSDCATGRCDPLFRACVPGCTSPLDCVDDPGRPYCTDGLCTECRSDSDCPSDDGVRRACDVTLHYCKPSPCRADVDCALSPHGRLCDTESGACVACLTDDHCPNDGLCSPLRSCVQCLSDDDCDASAQQICHPALHRCILLGCSGDWDCEGHLRCSLRSRECVACLDSADCVFGGVCAEGACVQPAACESDAQCVWPTLCDEGACAICREDADCPGDQFCAEGVCAEPSVCVHPEDCLAGRTCEADACVDAACDADEFEPNDGVTNAAPLRPLVEASLCANDEDFFALGLQPGAGAVVMLRFDEDAPPPSLELILGRAQERLVFAAEQTGPGTLRAEVERAPAGTRTLLVRVFGSPERLDYTLETTVHPGGTCENDARHPNDTPVRAALVPAGVHEGVLCAAEWDWFALDVPEGLRAEAWLTLTSGDSNDAELSIRGGSGGQDDEVAGGREHAASPVVAGPGGQRFWIGLHNTSRRGTEYVLELAATLRPPENDRCADALPLAANATISGTTRGAGDDGAAQCGGAGSPDAFWTLSVPEPSRVRVELMADFDAVLALSESCDGAELGCDAGTGSDRLLEFEALAAGTYVVRVDGMGGQQGAYSLATTVESAPPPPSGTDCEAPEALVFDAGVAEVSGSIAAAADDFPAPCGSSGGDAFYSLQLNAPARVRAVLEGFPGASLSLVSAAGCAQAEVAVCAEGPAASLDRYVVPAGKWLLVVDGGGWRRGAFALRVELSDAVHPPANDVCEGVIDLVGTVSGTTRGAGNAFVPACAAASHAAPDVVYRLVVEAEEQVTLSLAAGFDAALAVTAAPCGEGETLACADGLSPRIVLPALGAGEYFVWVDGYRDGLGEFTLAVNRKPALPVPAHDACENALAVALEDSPVTLAGSTRRASDGLHPNACVPRPGAAPLSLTGPDVVYAVAVAPGETLTATLLPHDFDGALYLLESCNSAVCVAASDDSFLAGGEESVTATNTGASATTWLVVVDAWQSAASGDFTLRLEAR